MSERANELINAFQNDAELQSKMQAASTPAERKQVVADAGFGDVSGSDAQAAHANATSGELSDEQLGAASGAGGFGITLPGGFGGGFSW